MLHANGIIKCVKDVVMNDGDKVFSEGKEYSYWKTTDRHRVYNDKGQPHVIYKEKEGDVDNFISDHFQIVS